MQSINSRHELPMPFFFSWYGDPRDLHSFPTRRSSDLVDKAYFPIIPLTPNPCQAKFEASFEIPLRFQSDRKSTRLNSSHTVISYAVFCLKKKKTTATCADFHRTVHL